MGSERGYRESILSSAETILTIARGRRLQFDPEIATAMILLEKAIAAGSAEGATHADIQAVVVATLNLSRAIRGAPM